MIGNLKALVVVIGIAMAVFIVAKPICLRFMAADDFARRRNVWLALTVVAFASPNFWVFALLAIVLLAWATSRDSNAAALYLLLLLALPPKGLQIPTIIINELFSLNYYRILSLAILVPAAWRLRTARKIVRDNGFQSTDAFFLAFAAWHLVLLMPFESFTNTMRRTTLFAIDAGVLYYVASRACTNRRAVAEAIACFCLAGAIAAPIAVFESVRHWLLYADLAEHWGSAIEFAYLGRSGSLRAQAAAGHAIALGWTLTMAFGFWLYLRSRVTPLLGVSIAVWLCGGLIASYSRGPWLAAAVLFFAHAALGPKRLTRFVMAVALASVAALVVLATPFGEQIVDKLPFIGTVGEETVTYRQQLAAVSWELIQMNPILGSPFVLLYLESLRQGQGIIDLVNTYATIAMYYGIPGLLLFLGFCLAGVRKAHRLVQGSRISDPDLALLGATLIACIVSMLFFMATGSFGTSLAVMYWVLPGLCAGLAQESGAQHPIAVQPTVEPQTSLGGHRSFRL